MSICLYLQYCNQSIKRHLRCTVRFKLCRAPASWSCLLEFPSSRRARNNETSQVSNEPYATGILQSLGQPLKPLRQPTNPHGPTKGTEPGSRFGLARISHHLTVEARNWPGMTSFCLLRTIGRRRVAATDRQDCRSLRRAPRTDGPLTHFVSLRVEKCGLAARGESPRAAKKGDSQPISARLALKKKAVRRPEIGGSPPFSPVVTSATDR